MIEYKYEGDIVVDPKCFPFELPLLIKNKIEHLFMVKDIEKNVNLFINGEPADHLFFILSGRVRTSIQTLDGKEITLTISQKDELIGEYLLFQPDILYTTSAIMLEAGQVAVIKRAALEALVREDMDLAIEMMKWMGTSCRRKQLKFRDLLLYGSKGALISILIRMSNSYGEQTDEGVKINLPLTNQNLADFVGSTREGVNRILNKLKNEKVLSFDNKFIIVHNLEILKQSIDCENCSPEICRI